MNRDETKRAAEICLRHESGTRKDCNDCLLQDVVGCRDQFARAFLAQCEREETVLEALKNCVQWMIEHGCSHEYAVLIDAKAAIKAIEEGRG